MKKKSSELGRVLDGVETQQVLLGLLTALIAARINHQTAHWQVRGTTSYGDHTLFDRLYTSIDAEIDTLAEKLVSLFGPESVDICCQKNGISIHLANIEEEGDSPVARSLAVEASLQRLFKVVYSELKERDELSLGMDDFLMAMANSHETNLYLLKQRSRS